MTLFIFTSKNFLNEFDMEQLAPIFCIEVDNNTQYINLDNLNDVNLIYVEKTVNKNILAQLLKNFSLFANALALKREDSTITLVSENVFRVSSEHSTTTSGKTAKDILSHSSLDVEKAARVAYDIAEKSSKILVNIDNAQNFSSSYVWRKVINDINEDYPSVELRNLLIEDFVIVSDEILSIDSTYIVDPYIKDIPLKVLLSKGFVINKNISLGEGLISLEIK